MSPTATSSMTEHWSNGGITPYNDVQRLAEQRACHRLAATGDFERLKDPALDADLTKLAGAATVSAADPDLVPLEKYVAANLPVIPLETAAEWFEYNSQHFVGWPTQQNPYETGQPSGTNNGPGSGTDEVVILHLCPELSSTAAACPVPPCPGGTGHGVTSASALMTRRTFTLPVTPPAPIAFSTLAFPAATLATARVSSDVLGILTASSCG